MESIKKNSFCSFAVHLVFLLLFIQFLLFYAFWLISTHKFPEITFRKKTNNNLTYCGRPGPIVCFDHDDEATKAFDIAFNDSVCNIFLPVNKYS